MSITTFQIGLGTELVAAGLGGLQGALFAASERHRRLDVLGVVVIGLTVALGGSLLRDIVLDQPPVVIWANAYLPVAAAGALVGMLLHRFAARAQPVITVLDAVVMGLFGAIGASKALSLGAGEIGAVVVGVIGAIGGGMLRDVILARPISFLHVGALYAVAAGAGAAALVLLVAFDVPVALAAAACVAVTATLRLLSVATGWTCPEQTAARPRGGPSLDHGAPS